MKKAILYFSVTALAVVGLITLFLSISVFFDLFGVRAMEGNYVLFVVWANFICGLLYLFSAYGFAQRKKWTAKLMGTSAIVLIVALGGLFLHINSGGLYEDKTVRGMAVRIGFTLVFMLIAFFTINKGAKKI